MFRFPEIIIEILITIRVSNVKDVEVSVVHDQDVVCSAVRRQFVFLLLRYSSRVEKPMVLAHV